MASRLSLRLGAMFGGDVGSAWLVELQFEEDIGVRTEARGEVHRRRLAIEPCAAVGFAGAGFAAVKRGCVAQAELRHHAATRLDAEAFHHFPHISWLTLLDGWHHGVPRPLSNNNNDARDADAFRLMRFILKSSTMLRRRLHSDEPPSGDHLI
jgi:hypothetical protein